MQVNGYWGDVWAPLAEAFAENFSLFNEYGAGFALYHRGQLAVNIWAGLRDNRSANISAQPWLEDTRVNIFSAGKGLVALCILQLVADGALDLDKPIADYWPGFAQAGKTEMTARQVLCHRSGMSAFSARLGDEQIYDWATMLALIEQQEPAWQPGTQQGYSPFLFGWILGELVRRVSGFASFNDYFQARIAQPLGVVCDFGIANDQLDRVADTSPLKRPIASPVIGSHIDTLALGKLMKADPRGITNRAFANPLSLMTAANSQAWRQAQIPAANAHCTAQALAAIYGNLAAREPTLLAPEVLPWCWQEQSFCHDQVLGLPLRFSLGFVLPQAGSPYCGYGRGARAFGHPGAGGAMGFADPDYQLGFGYVSNRMGQTLLADERALRLVDVVYSIVEGQKYE